MAKIFPKIYYKVIGLFFLIFYCVNKVLAEDESILGQLKKTSGKAGYGQDEINQNEIATRIGRGLSVFLGFLGVIFIVLIIYGGWIWMTARGNEEKIKKARELITEAIIGVVVIMAAYALTRFIVGRFGGAVGFAG